MSTKILRRLTASNWAPGCRTGRELFIKYEQKLSSDFRMIINRKSNQKWYFLCTLRLGSLTWSTAKHLQFLVLNRGTRWMILDSTLRLQNSTESFAQDRCTHIGAESSSKGFVVRSCGHSSVPVSPLLCLHDIMLQTSSAVSILLYNQRQQHKCIWHRPWPTRFKPFAERERERERNSQRTWNDFMLKRSPTEMEDKPGVCEGQDGACAGHGD
jgi:hypothetical protein